MLLTQAQKLAPCAVFAGKPACRSTARTVQSPMQWRSSPLKQPVRRAMLSSKVNTRSCRVAAPGLVHAALGNRGQVYVPAANGVLAVRIIKELLNRGCKVTAGVPDIDKGKAFLELAQKLEVVPSAALKSLSFKEVQTSDADSIIEGMPRRGARAVVVLGDIVNGRKADGRISEKILGALLDEDAPELDQLLLVVGKGGAGGGGFIGLGGGSGGVRLSKVEQAVVDSGVSTAIVRIANTDNVDPSYADVAGVVVGPLGALPSGLKLTNGQAAAVAASVLLQTPGSCVIEAGADVDSELVDIADAVEAALGDALIEQELEESSDDYEEVSTPSSTKSGFGSLPSFGSFGTTRGKKLEEVEEEGGEVEQKSGKKGGFGGFGTFKLSLPAKKSAQQEEEEDDTPPPPKRAPVRTPAAAPAAPRGMQKQPVAVATKEDAPAKKGGFLSALGFGQESVYADEIKN